MSQRPPAMILAVAAPPSSGTMPLKVNVKFRCLLVALTVVVVCIMAFNIIWLQYLLDEERRPNNHSNHRRPRPPADANYHVLDYKALFANEIKPHCQRRRTLLDIQNCFPLVRQLPPQCHTIQDWPTVQRCLTGRFRDEPVQHIHIVGERHSGTKFLTRELQACFPRKTNFRFRVHRDFIRSKHFFQPILAGHDLASSIVIVVVRNPVDWVSAMREKPYHSPNHVASLNETHIVPLDWMDFLQRPWTMSTEGGWDARSTAAAELSSPDDNDNNLLLPCQDNFHRQEVLPCEYNETSGKLPQRWIRGMYPLYEMQRDGSARPFSSVMELRREKILNFVLELPMLTDLSGFLIVRYEDMLRNGTKFVLNQIKELLQLDDEAMDQCHATPPQLERLTARQVPPDIRRYIMEHVDSEMERLLGYA